MLNVMKETLEQESRVEVGRERVESKASIFNTAVLAHTDFFTADLSPTFTP